MRAPLNGTELESSQAQGRCSADRRGEIYSANAALVHLLKYRQTLPASDSPQYVNRNNVSLLMSFMGVFASNKVQQVSPRRMNMGKTTPAIFTSIFVLETVFAGFLFQKEASARNSFDRYWNFCGSLGRGMNWGPFIRGEYAGLLEI